MFGERREPAGTPPNPGEQHIPLLSADTLDGVRKTVAMDKDGAPDNEIEAAVAYVGNALGALVATIPTA